jgi:nicotinate-nucleotide adenylyltransferase
MITIALFGTSADPPTVGHQAILGWLADRFDLVVVWAADNPFKSHGASLEQRSAMLQLLIQGLDIPDQNVGVYPDLSFARTIVTLEHAQQRWPQGGFTLVIGSDLVGQLPSWYRASELLSQVAVLVIPRPGYLMSDSELEKLHALGTQITIADLTGLNVSSTAYRERRDSDGVPPEIGDYIRQAQLYSDSA